MHTLEKILESRHLISGHPDECVMDALRRMSDAEVGALVVLDGDRLVGVFSERDLMTRVVVEGRDPGATRLGDVMTREVATADLHETRDQCLQKMKRYGCRHLPVLGEGHVIAMLSMRDLLRDEIAEHVEEIRHLRAYLYETPPPR